MKVIPTLVLILSMAALPAFGASPSALEQAYLTSCRRDPGTPVPVAVVSPTVGPEYHGTSVRLEFLVDANGKPSRFRVASATDDRLATAVVEAVKQWRFLPGEINGKPVAVKVALPVNIVDPALSGDRYAASR